MPTPVISLPEKSSSETGKGLVRSVAKPVVFDILQEEHRGKHMSSLRGGGRDQWGLARGEQRQ